jgi:gliding motility-associatede transport system auxiliary component
MAMKAETGSGHRVLPSVLFGAGLVAVYLGERMLEVGKSSAVVTVIGVLLAMAGFALRLADARTGRTQARPAELWLAWLEGLGLLALALYFLNSNLTFQVTGHTFEQRFPRVSGVVSSLWPALLFCTALPILFGELSLASMKRAPVLDLLRVRDAILSALGIGFALVLCFSVAYVASERDHKADLSYFRTARAGEATKKLVRALDKPVRIYIFFPPANEVREEVESYFGDLTRESRQLIVEQYDYALHPAKARELNVSANGVVVVARDAVKEQIPVPLVLESARSQLRILDQEVHKRILGVSRPSRVAYFTQGHEERTFDPIGEDTRPTVRALKDLITDQGYQVKDLGMAQGLGTDVPADAGLVLIIGPRKPFLKEETAALLRYIDRKGRLFIALDPENPEVTLDELLAPLSLKFNPVTLANDRLFLQRTYQHADRINIATGSYSSHASVSTIGRFGMRAPLILFGAGYLTKNEKGAVGIVNVDFTVHSDTGTWPDANGNFEHDAAKEVRAGYELAAAVNKRNASALAPEDEARAVVLTDSDGLSDVLLGRSVGNTYFVRDAVRWLGGEESITGTITTEEDVPVAHTRDQDRAWFYISTLAAPALVLAIGFVVTRRRRPARKSALSPPGPRPPQPPPSPTPEVSP